MTRTFPHIVVAKFGGTSVADFDAMSRSATIVLADKDVRLVVLSASAGVTNILVELSAGLDSRERLDKIETLRTIQYNIISRLKQQDAIRQEIDHLLDNISRLAEEAFTMRSAALSDALVSHGELMSSLLFVEVLRERDVETEWFDARKVIRTTDCFGCAEPVLDATAERVERRLRPRTEQALVVTQGFIGREANGQTTTLGRGGSDYTASLLGEALHAARVDIWTDVAGIYTTDPRLVSRAQRIGQISFSEASEMATFGAKVLHPATLLPAMRKNIPVFVGSSKYPSAGGTLVCRDTENPPRYRALAVRRQQTLMKLHCEQGQSACRFLADTFALLARHDVAVDSITTSETSIALILNAASATSGESRLLTTSLLTELSSHCRVEVETGLALVSLIGNSLSQAEGVCHEVFAGLEKHPVRLICHGVSRHSLGFLLPADAADDAVKALHHRLFE
ncbi:lysine-sensitive aspartokinase 3 [Kosakonia oryziphila]|uniref:Aspartokinase n=1 Tax=Kosakonia oryziphila TaxID=1005667 RepID=A0A1C4CQQ5_9ENTR|nr:lysine-sensitive aspartokinase 3 [Kosakonia oryziphila]SCC21359.1 aspartate kinase [Kosakonia oryziphila]